MSEVPTVPAIQVGRSEEARIFVGVEFIWLGLGLLTGLVLGTIGIVQGIPWYMTALLVMLSWIGGALLMLINMVFRTINYLLRFITMADLLDQTRLLITGLFSPGNKGRPGQQPAPHI